MAVLQESFGHHFEHGHLSLSVDIKEMRDGMSLALHNIPDVDAKT